VSASVFCRVQHLRSEVSTDYRLCIAIFLFLVGVFLPLVGGLRIRRKKK